jgi:mRNA interferase MazF
MSIGRAPAPLADRGDIFSVDLDPVEGSEQGGTRPSVVVSPGFMNVGGTVVIVPLTTSKLERIREYEALVPRVGSGLREDSKAKANQIRTVAATRLGRRIGVVPPEAMEALDAALGVALGIEDHVIA